MLQLKIGQHIDHFGFNGREHAPADSDKGRICRVLAMETLYLEITQDDEKKVISDILSDGEAIDIKSLLGNEYKEADFKCLKDSTVDVYYVITEDYRVLEVMEHEVESISLVRE